MMVQYLFNIEQISTGQRLKKKPSQNKPSRIPYTSKDKNYNEYIPPVLLYSLDYITYGLTTTVPFIKSKPLSDMVTKKTKQTKIIENMVAGKRNSGAQQHDKIIKWTQGKFGSLNQATQNRETWSEWSHVSAHSAIGE